VSPTFTTAKTSLRRRFGLLAPYLPELVAIRHDLRTALQVTVPLVGWPVEGPRLQSFCDRAGLTLEVHTRGGSQKAVISRNGLGVVPDAGTAGEAGRWFSYPTCCVEAYTSQGPKRTGDDFVNRMHTLVVDAPDRIDFRLNPFLRTSPFHLFKHFPCSLGCEATTELAERTRAHLERDLPELHAALQRFGRSPVLFLDSCGRGLSLDSARSDQNASDGLAYEAVFTDGDPTAQLGRSQRHTQEDVDQFLRIQEALATGDALTLVAGTLHILSDTDRVATFERPDGRVWKVLDFW